MQKRSDKRALLDEYKVPGFKTLARVESCEEGSVAFVITLVRRQKKRHAAAAERFIAAFMIDGAGVRAIWIAVSVPFISTLNGAAWIARCAA
jgi:hypothetical protein